jgi:acetyl esterase/lipase
MTPLRTNADAADISVLGRSAGANLALGICAMNNELGRPVLMPH